MTHAVSYCDTALMVCGRDASDAVPGLPAYTLPACPARLNGEPVAEAAAPGVTLLLGPHVFVGAPGWPVARAGVPPNKVKLATQATPSAKSRTSLFMASSIKEVGRSPKTRYRAVLRAAAPSGAPDREAAEPVGDVLRPQVDPPEADRPQTVSDRGDQPHCPDHIARSADPRRDAECKQAGARELAKQIDPARVSFSAESKPGGDEKPGSH